VVEVERLLVVAFLGQVEALMVAVEEDMRLGPVSMVEEAVVLQTFVLEARH